MATSITLASAFDISSIIFAKLKKNKNGGKTVYINSVSKGNMYVQLPFMRAPFGLSAFTDAKSGKVSYSVDLSFDMGDPAVEDLMAKLRKLDEYIVKMVADNSVEWLGKKYTVAVLKEALYKPLVRAGSGDFSDKFTMKLKVMADEKTGDFYPEAYNHKRENVPLNTIEKNQRMMCIVDFNQIWFVDNKFGVGVRLQQCLLEPSKKLPKFAFQGVTLPAEEEEEEEEEEDGEVDDEN
jgi:hypothetical protein